MARPIKFLGAAALAAAALVGFAPHALAEEGDPVHEVEELVKENGGTEFDAHCVEILAEGGAIDDCQAAPNPLLPEMTELIWGGLAFLIVFFFIWKMGLPAIKKGMDARTERIRSDLAAAETQRSEADQLLADYRAQLADAKNESARIIEEARQSADALKREQEARLTSELAEMRERAAADIEAAKTQAIADLRGEVAQLAVGAAEVVVSKNLDQATQVQLIEDYINQVANRS
ncbi:MAG: F0F1 ATP synthase subunit B [Acidimicrobiia bacterium]